MYSEKEKAALKKKLETIRKCKGNCKDCKKLLLETTNTKNALYYAFGCKVAPDFSPISNSTKTLKADLIEQLQFELS